MKYSGLNDEEVQRQIGLGNVNTPPKPVLKSNTRIIASHVFTLFNAYNFVIALSLIAVQAYSSLFFLLIVFSNIFIFASQEIKSKNMVAKLKMIVTPQTKAVRNYENVLLNNDDIVLNDIIFLEAGSQVSCDCIIIDVGLEVDESLITGEADPIFKQKGDTLLSGSFILSGSTYAKVIHVGSENYALKITNEAAKRKPAQSKLMDTFNYITKITSYLIFPISGLLVYQGLFIRHDPQEAIIMATATSLLGMLPKGLVLLTSLSLAAGVVKLGSKKALVQELFSIETLARIDVLCLDKTGTLTKGKLEVSETQLLNGTTDEYLNDIMASFVSGARDNNATYKTLSNHYSAVPKYESVDSIPFSSARKYSAVSLKDIGCIVVGAPEFIFPQHPYENLVNEASSRGSRVLMVALYPSTEAIDEDNCIPKILALININDPLRSDAKATLKFFSENQVDIKIISGDNPITVNAIALEAGFKSAGHYLDATTLKNDDEVRAAILKYDIIGRATPQQKHQMILSLQAHNNIVAMTGDGVNDVLALKDADVSIAMGGGSDVTKQVAHVVVVDENLQTLVDIVKEGRLVINNVTRSASMYYLKTIYTIALSILAIILNIPFPFIPFQITLMDMFISGFPSFMLMFERNTSKPVNSITEHSLRYALPNAVAIVFVVAVITLIAGYLNLNINEVFTIIYFTTAFIAIHMIYRIYKPLTKYRAMVLLLDILGFIISVPIFFKLLQLSTITSYLLLIIIVSIIASIPVLIIIRFIVMHFLNKRSFN